MKKPKIAARESAGSKFITLDLIGGSNPGSAVVEELANLSTKHGLPPNGGCFDVTAKSVDGTKESFLGGLKVQRAKYRGFAEDLRDLGYEVIE